MTHQGAPSSGTRPVAPALFSHAILVALMVGVMELLSYAIWETVLDGPVRRNIKALCHTGSANPQKIPNAFWHHALNPRNEMYARIVNTKGTIGEDFAVPKPAGELRIICVGDSTVEGTGVQPTETFPHLLEQSLKTVIERSARYRSVRVINAGVGSHNSAFSLAYLQRLIHYQPDVVIIKSAYNDYLPYCIPGMQYDYTHAFPQPFCLATSPGLYWSLARYSYFLRISGFVLFRDEVLNPFGDFSGHITRAQFQAMDFSANEDRFSVYAENIRSMILTCTGRGIRVFVLDLPTSPNPDAYGTDQTFGIRFRELIRRLETELRRVTLEEQVPLISTGPLEATDFWDHCHNTAAGNQKIAQRIAATLIQQLGL